jgi:hypothetical protein
MQLHLAIKTLQAFHQAVAQDQGATYRQHLQRVLPHINDAYRGEDEGFRNHLGASGIGKDCGRAIWYSHRWATKSHYDGRMLRLFNRGHLEEGRFISLMLTIGVQVYQQDAEGKQFRISYFGGHYGGSGDGVAVGIPDLASGQAALTEFKTHNNNSFTKLAGKNWGKYNDGLLGLGPVSTFDGVGVREAKFEHWIQMQSYMRAMGLAVAVYFAINKDNDHIYAELVSLDSGTADKFTERARTIIIAQEAPPMINKSVGWYGCKFCDHFGVCKGAKSVEVNCRTCAYSEPNIEDGTWRCGNSLRSTKTGDTLGILSKETQLVACEFYEKNKTM